MGKSATSKGLRHQWRRHRYLLRYGSYHLVVVVVARIVIVEWQVVFTIWRGLGKRCAEQGVFVLFHHDLLLAVYLGRCTEQGGCEPSSGTGDDVQGTNAFRAHGSHLLVVIHVVTERQVVLSV